VGAVTEHQNVYWLTAYALGIAFSVPNDAAACAQILAVTSDRRDLLQARARLGAAHVTDPGTRRRAAELLSRALVFTEDAATPSSAATASHA
jgi:hypothetical protein